MMSSSALNRNLNQPKGLTYFEKKKNLTVKIENEKLLINMFAHSKSYGTKNIRDNLPIFVCFNNKHVF